jgi:uncharacterized phage protein gp47/JayE
MTDELTSAGLNIDDLQTRIDALVAELRVSIAPNIDAEADSSEGQFIRLFAERAQSIGELIQAVHSSQYPEGAIGVSLEALALLTGTARKQATKSIVVATCNIDPGTYLAGTLIAHVAGDPTARFVSIEDAVNSGGSPADIDVDFEAEETGIVRAYAGTLTVIAEAVTGWNSVTNAVDAIVGTVVETDAELRLRRQEELASGSANVNAISTDISQIEGVEFVTVYENDTDVTDANGLPPHSVECIVHAPGVTDDDIAEVIFASKAGGIQAHGDTIVVVQDNQGENHAIGLTRAAVVDVYCAIDINIIEENYSGDSVVKQAIADHGDSVFGVGDTISIAQIIFAAMNPENVLGVDDVTEVRLGTSYPPTQTTSLSVGSDEIGNLDTARIEVNTTAV